MSANKNTSGAKLDLPVPCSTELSEACDTAKDENAMPIEPDISSAMAANTKPPAGGSTQDTTSTGLEQHSSSSEEKEAEEKPNLSNLTQEVFDLITDEVDLEDLRNLRLVAKGMNAKVLDTFATRHFSEYSFLLNDKESLITARKVAEHPVFGPKVRKLTIHLDRLYVRYNHWNRWEDRDEDDYTRRTLCGSREELEKRLRWLDDWRKPEGYTHTVNALFNATTAQEAFVYSKKHRKLLNTVLEALTKQTRTETVAINTVFDPLAGTCYETRPRRNARTRQRFESLNLEETIWPVAFGFYSASFDDSKSAKRKDSEHHRDSLSLIMEVLAHDNVRLKGLTLDLMATERLDIGKISQDAKMLANCKKVFSGLDNLHVGIGYGNYSGDDSADDYEDPYEYAFEDDSGDDSGDDSAGDYAESLDAFLDALGSATGLNTLRLEVPKTLLFRVLSHAAFPRVSHLSLSISCGWHRNRFPSLLKAVRSLATSSRSPDRLDLEYMQLTDCGEFLSKAMVQDSWDPEKCSEIQRRDSTDEIMRSRGYANVSTTNDVGKALRELIGIPGTYAGIARIRGYSESDY